MNKNNGFILITVMAFLVITSIVGASMVQIAAHSNNSASKHTQIQIAQVASKAAVDYAAEQYDRDSEYSGTTEQDLFVNDFYRATIEVVVISSEGLNAKKVRGIGRVYIPETSSTADVVRDITVTIIRDGEHYDDVDDHDDDHDKHDNHDNHDDHPTNPESFNPLLWLDANEENSLYKAVTSNTQTIDSLYGQGNGDIVEERGSDASDKQGELKFGGDDLEMSWDGNGKGHQAVGIRFRGVTAPKASTINNAYIQFTTDETKTAGPVQLLVHGVASDNAGSWSGDYAVTSAPKTTATVTWSPENWNIVGSSGVNERLDVTAIVQELVNRSGWANGNAMAFSISWTAGSGVRTAEKEGNVPQLFIQWEGSGGWATEATLDGDNIDQWYDRSSNNNNAVFSYGVRPILKLNQVFGKNAVRFSSNGALLSSIDNLSDKELTAFIVMAPRTTSSVNARFLSLMNSAQSNDDNTPDGLVPFMKSGSTTTIQQFYNNTLGRTSVAAIDGNWATYSSRLSNTYSEGLMKNSSPANFGSDFTVDYTVDQVYIGGRRSGVTGVDYADADIAEIVVYDRALVCSEIQLIENYFENKYGFTYIDKTCP